MGSLLHTFEPSSFGVTITTIILLTVALAFLIFLFFQNKKRVPYYEKKRKGLYSMLLFFGFLIFGTTAFFNGLYSLRLKTVKLYENAIELPSGQIKYENIQASYIYIDKPTTLTTPSPELQKEMSKRLLVIDEYKKKTSPSSDNIRSHVLAEENYPIDDILKEINKILKKD